MTTHNRFIRPLLVIFTLGLMAALIIPFATRATRADQQTIALPPGKQLVVTCETGLSGDIQGNQATLNCAPLPEPTAPPAPSGPQITELRGVSEGAALSGTVNIEAVVQGQDIKRVVFTLNGPKPTIHTEKIPPYFFLGDTNGTPKGWDTTQYPNGEYTLNVAAVDGAGQTGTVEVHFTVANNAPPPPPTATPAPQPTATPAPPPPTPPPPSSNVGVCGESLDAWHPPVVNGCATGHEHGDPPPDWIAKAGYTLSFHGPFNTSPKENTAKHQAMKGFSAKFNGTDVYFRVHAASNPLDRMARYHSYEVFARDPSGNVSHWQLWYNTGDPRPWNQGGARVVRRNPPLPEEGQRPIMLVVDQAAWDAGIRCEQWYSAPGEPAWGWDFGWTICNTTTLYQENENATAEDPSTWKLTGDLGLTRRLEAAWYASRQHPTGKFWSTQFGEIVSGPNDPKCSATTNKFGTTYQNICLEQYIAPTMVDVKFPGNAAQKGFDGNGVKVPN